MTSKKTYQVEDGTIHDGHGVLYDCLDDWLSKEGQQILCDILNEGGEHYTFEEIEPFLKQRLVRNAAPDLLEACEAALAWFQEWHDIAFGKGSHRPCKVCKEQIGPLRAAIAKAKGEVSNG